MRLALNKKIYDNASQALDAIRTMTEQSVGRGGIAHHRKISTTWHHLEKVNRAGCEFIGIPVQEEAAFFNPFSPHRFRDGPLYVKEKAI